MKAKTNLEALQMADIVNHRGEVEVCPPEVSAYEFRSLHEVQRRIVRNWMENQHKGIDLHFSGIASRGRTTVIFLYRDPALTKRDPGWLHAWEVTYDPITGVTTEKKTH